MQRKLEARQAEAEEVTAKHWSHLLFVEEICRTKADNEMMLHKLDEQTSALNVVDEKHTSKVNELILDTKKHNDATDKYLQHLDQRLQTEEETMLTKSTLTEAQELRDKIGMCALRAETRELLDVLRQEVAARVRMMKERLDRTDHELMRQLEESYTTDRSERLTSVVQQLDAKAEKESLERMSESTQQMYAELQALHVRTQTLGQGMKVVLGWFEGMSDKVNGLQGAQRHIQHQIAVTKEETVTALNEATKATISRVKNLVNDKATAAQQQADKSFRPLSRPRSSAAPSGPVSVKPGQTSPTIGDHNSPRVNPSPPADIAALGDSVGELSGSHLAGAAGVALGAIGGLAAWVQFTSRDPEGTYVGGLVRGDASSSASAGAAGIRAPAARTGATSCTTRAAAASAGATGVSFDGATRTYAERSYVYRTQRNSCYGAARSTAAARNTASASYSVDGEERVGLHRTARKIFVGALGHDLRGSGWK